MFSRCPKPCITCGAYGGGCLAGHGDDLWSRALDEQLQERLIEAKGRLVKVIEDGGESVKDVKANAWMIKRYAEKDIAALEAILEDSTGFI